MKNITFSADEALIEAARKTAAVANTTLDELFREWLAALVTRPAAAVEYERLTARLTHVHSDGKFSRDEMNERRD